MKLLIVLSLAVAQLSCTLLKKPTVKIIDANLCKSSPQKMNNAIVCPDITNN